MQHAYKPTSSDIQYTQPAMSRQQRLNLTLVKATRRPVQPVRRRLPKLGNTKPANQPMSKSAIAQMFDGTLIQGSLVAFLVLMPHLIQF